MSPVKMQVEGYRVDPARAHLRAAALLARRAQALEQELLKETDSLSVEDARQVHARARLREDDERYPALQAFVTGAILAAVAAMEAMINNIYISAYETHVRVEQLREAARLQQGTEVASSITDLQTSLAHLWMGDPVRPVPSKSHSSLAQRVRWAITVLRTGKIPSKQPSRRSIAYASLSERLGAALKDAQRDRSAITSWNDANDVSELRNLLSHNYAGTTWLGPSIEPGVGDTTKVENSLKDKRKSRGGQAIEPSILCWGLTFPYTHLNHQCVVWAVTTSATFINECGQVFNYRSLIADEDAGDRARGRTPRYSPNS